MDFNGLLPVGPSVTLFLVWCINHYSCHLWETYLMYAVVICHMNDATLMDEASLMDKVGFLFFWTRVIFLLIIKYDHYLE